MNKRIILNSDEVVTCPECGHAFALHQGITLQTIERYEQEFDAVLGEERKSLQASLEKEASRRAEKQYQEQIETLREQLQEGLEARDKMKAQIDKATKKAAADARAEAEAEAGQLRDELEARDKKLEAFRNQELELRREKQALEEARKEQELELQRRLDAGMRKIEQKTAGEYRLREAELQKKIRDAQEANETLKRKLEQGSAQLQGEVLELELEELLGTAFPLDGVEAVRKGVRGADVIQQVRTRTGYVSGKIIWEAKRAENWSNRWIAKLKDDQQAANAELAVLVSTVFPTEVHEPFLQMEGIWLVRPHAVRPVAEVLRTVLLESQKQKAVSLGKNEKMESLYDYICSPQFAQKVRGVVDAYGEMLNDLEREKAAMARLWKKRETQIERITMNMMGMCGELQGIAENALPQLDSIGLLIEEGEPEDA